MPEAVLQMAEPMVSQNVIAFYLLGELVAKQVKVVLLGQGADEVFGGYFWYPQLDAAEGTALERFRAHYFDRDHDEYLEMICPAHHVGDVTAELVANALAQPRADTRPARRPHDMGPPIERNRAKPVAGLLPPIEN